MDLLNHKITPEEIIKLVKRGLRDNMDITFPTYWWTFWKKEMDQQYQSFPMYENAAVECINPAPVRDTCGSVLPMIISGRYEETVYDTGAAANFMSLEKAQELGLEQGLDTQERRSYILGNKKQVLSIGTIAAKVSFAMGDEADKGIMCYFNVLEKLAVPILMGEPFLRATKTLSKYRDRLSQGLRHVFESTRRRVFAIGSTQNEVVCIIDGKEVLALADTGSEVSLMKSVHADKLGISYQPGIIELEFADGSIEHTTGFADLSVSLGGKFRGRARTVETRVYIFENLVCDFLIDKTLVEKLNVFGLGANQTLSAAKTICSGYLCAIKKLKRLEKWVLSIRKHSSSKYALLTRTHLQTNQVRLEPTIEEEIRSLEGEDNRLIQQEHWRRQNEKGADEQQEENCQSKFATERAARLRKLNDLRQLLQSTV
jgi:hypothetical protein